MQAGRRIALSFHHTPDFVTVVFQIQVVNANVRDLNHRSPSVLTHTLVRVLRLVIILHGTVGIFKLKAYSDFRVDINIALRPVVDDA